MEAITFKTKRYQCSPYYQSRLVWHVFNLKVDQSVGDVDVERTNKGTRVTFKPFSNMEFDEKALFEISKLVNQVRKYVISHL